MDKAIRATMLADQIRDYLATWVAREFPGSFLGISAVTLAPNMTKATVWVTLSKNDVRLFSELQKKERHYKHLLVQHLTRYKVPNISFAIDTRPELP
jgi:ribosome-binding factor A